MELEYQTVMVDINENFQNEIQKYIADKWEILPGSKAVAIYNLVRIKQQQVAGIGGFGSMQIDESKITLIRGGKVVRPDGSVEGEGKVISGEAKLG